MPARGRLLKYIREKCAQVQESFHKVVFLLYFFAHHFFRFTLVPQKHHFFHHLRLYARLIATLTSSVFRYIDLGTQIVATIALQKNRPRSAVGSCFCDISLHPYVPGKCYESLT